MLFSLQGTKKGERVFISGTKWDGLPFERMNSLRFSGRIIEVKHKTKEHEGDIVNQFSIAIESNGERHHFLLKGGSLAVSVVNTIAGATIEQLEHINIAFYTNKDGFNSVYITDKYENRIQWKISSEEREKLIRKFEGKWGKMESDTSNFVEAIIAIIPNIVLPVALVKNEWGDLFDEVRKVPVTEQDLDELF